MIFTEQQARDAFVRYDQELCTIGMTDAVGRFLELLNEEGGETEQLHRCTACGKWSYAKRKPRHHRRFILSGSDPEHPDWTAENIAADLELETDEVVQPLPWSGDPEEDEDPGGAWVRCGPFATYIATREDS